MIKIIKLSILLLLPLFIQGQLSSFKFSKSITTRPSQVAGADHSDFPILIKHIDPDLAHISNGGNVENINGYDIIFTGSDRATILDHELAHYNPVSGEILAWVKTPTLSGSLATKVFMYYGDSSVSTSPSTSNTWDSGFKAVYHFDGAPFLDASNRAGDLTNNGASAVSAQHSEGASFNNNNLDVDNPGELLLVDDLTLDIWVNLNTVRNGIYDNVLFSCGHQNTGFNFNYPFWLNVDASDGANKKLRAFWEYGSGNEVDILSDANISLAAGEWTKLSFTRNSTNNEVSFYQNGIKIGSTISYANGPNGGAQSYLWFGKDQEETTSYLNGIIDEARISNVLRSSDWIQTDFNNQNKLTYETIPTLNADINAFYAVGPHAVNPIGTSAGLPETGPVRFVPFDTSSDDGFVAVTPDAANKGVYAVGYVDSDEAFGSSMGAHNGQRDGVLAKFNNAGNLLWYSYIGGPSNDFITDVSVAPTGEVLVTGYFNGSATVVDATSGGTNTAALSGLNYESFIACFNPDGSRNWIKSYGGSNNDIGLAIATNEDKVYTVVGFENFAGDINFDGQPVPPIGNAFILGYGFIDVGLGNTSSYALLAHDLSGNLLWKSYFGSNEDDLDLQASKLLSATDFQNADITIENDRIYVASLFSKSESLYDANNNYFIDGNQGTAIDDDIMFMEYALNGSPVWQTEIWINNGKDAKHLNITSDCNALYLSATVDALQGLYLNGIGPYFAGSGYDPALFKASLDDGTIEWVRHFETPSNSYTDEYISDISCDGLGNVFSTGAFKTAMTYNLDFPGSEGTLTPFDDFDMFIGYFEGVNGEVLNIKRAGQLGADNANGIFSDADRVLVVGAAEGLDEFPDSPGGALNGSTNLVLAMGRNNSSPTATTCCTPLTSPTAGTISETSSSPYANGDVVSLSLSGNSGIPKWFTQIGGTHTYTGQQANDMNLAVTEDTEFYAVVRGECGVKDTVSTMILVSEPVENTGCSAGDTTLFPAGTWIIAMDNLNQPGESVGLIPAGYPNAGATPGGTTPFNLKAYGLAYAMLDNEIPLYWAIASEKAKDGVDITAEVDKIRPGATAPAGTLDFRSGPMVIHPNDTTAARTVVDAFGNGVRVYRTVSAVSIEYKNKLAFKPKALLLTNGGEKSGEWQYEKHAALFTIAGIPATAYDTSKASDISLDANTCYSIAMEAHWKDGEDATNGTLYANAALETQRVRQFVEGGGNLLVQCAGIAAYENEEFFHSDLGMEVTCGGDCAPYTDVQKALPHTETLHDDPFFQIHGALESDPTGTYVGMRLTPGGSYHPSVDQHVIKDNVEGDQVAGAIKLTPAADPGGFVYYLGGHDYRKKKGDDKPYEIGYVNGIRMILNALFVPPNRPGCADISFCANSVPTDIAYATDIIEIGSGDLYPTVNSNPGGVFSEDTGGLIIDPTTGVIDTDNSSPGVYTVVYSNGGDSASFTILILDTDLCNYFPSDSTTSAMPGLCEHENFTYDFNELDTISGITITQTSGLASGTDFPVDTTMNTFDVTLGSQDIERLYFGWNDVLADPAHPDYGPNGTVAGSGIILPAGGSNGGALISDMISYADIRLDGAYFEYDGFDISFDFAHDGSEPTWGGILDKDNSFNIGFANIGAPVFGVSITTVDPATMTPSTVAWPLPSPPDNAFHSYRYRFDPNTGELIFQADYTSDVIVSLTTPGHPLNHDGISDLSICDEFIGTLTGLIDELRITEVTLDNEATCKFTVIVEDTEAPIITGYDTDSWVVGGCSATFGSPFISDNCPGPYTKASDIGPNVSGVGTHTIIWTVTDAAGNTTESTRTLTITDSTDPVADNASLADVTAQCQVTSITAPSATDNCDGPITGTTATTFPITTQGTTVVTWTYTDGQGNAITQAQNVIIDDTIAPVADNASLSDVTTQCQVTSITAPTATDNCDGAVTGTTGTTFPITASTTVTWTYTDGEGNASTQDQTVIIDDITAPVADNASLADVTAQCQVTSITAPTATDNCDGAVTGTTGTTFPITTSTTVTWTYTDGEGNTSTQDQNVLIDDTTAPVADNASLSNVTAQCQVTSITAPTATDNCDGAVTGTTGTTFPITTSTTVTWTYTDGAGNASTQDQTVIIDDTTAPVADSASLSDVTAQCQVTSITAPTASDNCDGAVTGTTGTTFPITTSTTVTWTYTDGAGNASTQDQTVIIDDTTAPVADNASLSDVTAQCQVTSITAPTATDNCSGTVIGATGTTFPITTQGTTVVTWTYTDGEGNTSTQDQNVIIDDTTAPVADNASLSDVTAQCQVTSITAPTATDNCDGAITGTTGTTLPITTQGTTVVTWTYTDGEGNTSTQDQNVIIDDSTAPVADNASLSDVTAQCQVTSITAPTATDNCDGVITGATATTFPITTQGTTVVTWTYTDGEGNESTQDQNVIIDDTTAPVADNASLSDVTAQCQVTSITAPTATDNCDGAITGTTATTFPITTQGTTVVTWTYTDAEGNTSAQNQNIIIDDTTAPVADNASLSAVTEQCQVTSITAPTATDNCDGAVTGTTATTFPITTQGTTVVTWTYTDGEGNASTQDQTVIIDDTTAPVADNASLSDVTEQCEVTSITAPTATDNCGGTVTGTTSTNFPITASITVTWTYTDAEGNSSTQDQTVSIEDSTAPVGDNASLADITAQCQVSSIIAPTATDNCSGTVTGTTSTNFPINASTTLTWTYTDGEGNTSTQDQNVFIDDTTAPVADNASLNDVTAQCQVTSITAPTATDNCDGTVTGTTATAFPITTQGTTVVTWTYTDGSGNSTNQTQDIVINDTTSPVANVEPLPAVIDQCSISSLNNPFATDNCGGAVTVSHDASLPITTQGTTTVTWTYTDSEGNTSQQTQDVIIEDTTNPSIICPSDFTATLDENCEYSILNLLDEVLVSDNCTDTDLIQIERLDNEGDILTGNEVVHQIIIQAEDLAMNMSTCTVNITTEDLSPPSIICPDSIATTTSLGTCFAELVLTPATALDNCTESMVSNSFSGTDLNASFPTGLTVVTWQAADFNGNFRTCEQDVWVFDEESPTMETTELSIDMIGCSYSLEDLTGQLNISDNCTEFDVLIITSDPIVGTDLIENTQITYFITDASGNSTEAVLDLIINDLTAPNMTCMGDIEVTAEEGFCEATVTIELPTVEVCDYETYQWLQGDDQVGELSFPTGITELDYTVVDDSGNSTTCTITVTVNASSEAAIVCPGDIDMSADPASCDATILLDLPEIQGFCSPEISNSFNDEEQAGGGFNIGVTEVTYVVVDAISELSCTVLVTVFDETLPTFVSCPAAVAQCGTSITMEQPEVSDLCGAVTFSNDFNNSENASGNYPVGLTEVIWTATDEYGNSATCSTQVEAQDDSVEISAGEDIVLDYTFNYVLNASLPAGASGIWSVVDGTVEISDLTDPNAIIYDLGLGTTVLEWTVDNGLCGIQSDQMTIYIEDFLIPTGYSPNGDGVNDTYHIRGLESLDGHVKLEVFTRWGTSVYSNENYKNEWAGENMGGNQLPPDTYYCIIELPGGFVKKAAVELRK